MNTIKATIIDIENIENLNIVTFDFQQNRLLMMSLELSEDMKIGKTVYLEIKSTQIVLAKDFKGSISCTNQLKATIKSYQHGKLLSSISLYIKGTTLEAIITKESAMRLDLKVDDEVTIFINSSELSIKEVLDD
jgi:molybdopterin-binding protein